MVAILSRPQVLNGVLYQPALCLRVCDSLSALNGFTMCFYWLIETRSICIYMYRSGYTMKLLQNYRLRKRTNNCWYDINYCILLPLGINFLCSDCGFFAKEVNPRLAKRPLVFNGRLANLGLICLVKEAAGRRWSLQTLTACAGRLIWQPCRELPQNCIQFIVYLKLPILELS